MKEIRPAATILLLRLHPQNGLETLLLKRNKKLKFGPGFWVFPGGKIEEADIAATDSEEAAAKLAAVREAKEEAGLDLSTDALTYFCHWTTPIIQPRRFSTSFFYAFIEDGSVEIIIDDSEIKDHLWITPKEALAKSKARTLPIMPPTFLALQRIQHCTTNEEVLAEFKKYQPRVLPTIGMKDKIIYCLYEGDAGFKNGDVDCAGPRHRLVGPMDGNYTFEYSADCEVAAVNGGNHV